MDHLLSMEKASARNSVYETKKKVEIQKHVVTQEVISVSV